MPKIIHKLSSWHIIDQLRGKVIKIPAKIA